MFKKKNVIVAIVCLLALTAWSGTAVAELVADGGFEAGGGWGAWRAYDYADTPPIYPHGGLNAVAVENTDVYAGTYSAELTKDTYGPGQYSFADQDGAALTPGLTYTFSFAAKKVSGDANSRLSVYSNAAGLTYSPVTVGTSWTTFSYTAVATGAGNYIEFEPANTAFDPRGVNVLTNPTPDVYRIDAVSITLAPEPSTLVLVATGLFGLLCYAWRKRK